MNAPTKKPKAAETVEEILAGMDKKREENLRIWNVLGKTDPDHTSGFKRAGGFSGTALKPMWVNRRLTEYFGPVGIGWGMDEPQFTTVCGQDGEVLVYCTVRAWYLDGGEKASTFGVGGDKVAAWVGRDQNRRLVHDDEAFKKAFTDALGNAFKFVGVGADVHMGLFDDSKYVAAVREEFHPKEEPPISPRQEGDMSDTALRGSIKALIHNLNGVGSVEELEALLDMAEAKETVEQCQRRFPHWWETGEGMPKEFTPLKKIIDQTRKGLAGMEQEMEQEYAAACIGDERNNR